MEISPRMVIDWLNSDGTSWSQKLFLAIGVTEGLLKKAPLRGLDTKLMLPMDGSPRHVAARITSNPENIAAAEMRFHHSASSDGTAHSVTINNRMLLSFSAVGQRLHISFGQLSH